MEDNTAAPPLAIPAHIAGLRPYVPGKPVEEVQRELGLTDVIKLASNENPLGPSPHAVAALTAMASQMAQYPEGAAPALRAVVSRHQDVPPECLVFGSGSDEILHLLSVALLQPGDAVVQADPSFAMYAIYAAECNAEVIKVPLDNYTHDLEAMAEAITPRTRIVYVTNPNNPTGTLVTQTQLAKFMDRVPQDVLVVFDEAYDEYVRHPDKPDTRLWVREGRNVAILHTFSKAYGLAGLRVGYGIMRPALAEILNRVRSPFNVNMAAQAAAVAALEDQAHVRESVTVNAEGKRYLYAAFQQMRLEFVPSQANFVLVDVQRDSRAVFEALQRRGVIVRAGAGLGLPQHIRVTVGTMPQNQRFVEALRGALEEIK